MDTVMEITEKLGGIRLDATYVDILIGNLMTDSPDAASTSERGIWLKCLMDSMNVFRTTSNKLLSWERLTRMQREDAEGNDD